MCPRDSNPRELSQSLTLPIMKAYRELRVRISSSQALTASPSTQHPTSLHIEDPHLREQMNAKLSWGGESASLGGTLLLATFSVPRAGNFLVHVTLDQQHVSGSPLVLRVAPAAACGSLSEATGEALSIAEAGKHEAVRVWLRDRYGNARRHSDEPVAGELSASLQV